MKKKIALAACLMCAAGLYSQQLAIYEFTGGISTVSTQPPNSSFGSFNPQNVYAVTSGGEYETSFWTTEPEFDPEEYIEFEIHTINCYRFNLDSIVFNTKRSLTSGNTIIWHLRSNQDDYFTDLASGTALTFYSPETITFNPANLDSLSNIRFRFYVTDVNAGQYFYLDDFAVYGSEVLVGPVDYYIDNDHDGYGTGNLVSSCDDLFYDYAYNNLDCDDTQETINPETRWYADLDGDNFGDLNTSVVSCLQPLSYVYINPYDILIGQAAIDCNDNNVYINPDAFEDECPDGEDQNCDGEDGDPGMIMPHCDYIMDADGDGYGYGGSVYAPCGCGSEQYYFDLGYIFGDTGDDCNDTIASIHPDAADLFSDGIDQNCDGQDGNLGLGDLSVLALNVYPNPGTDLVNLPIPVPGKRKIKLLDNQGKIIFEQEVTETGILQINTASFAKGSYQFVLQSEEGISRTSWMKL
jgi:hypothetical protein